uniref:Trehalase n=1 Tax=Harmonia axyridis TaxID=115357 RepID=K0E693_HARAX|nr:trehalase 1-3 [Harmonia axyridis]
MYMSTCFVFVLFTVFKLSVQSPYYQCDDPIFCSGKVLHTVQSLRIYRHSKTFVDLKMSNTPDVILQNFDIFMFKNAHKPSAASVRKFLRENFGDGDELETWLPPDFKNNPSWLLRIKDQRIRKFAFDLLQVIPKITRKVRQNVLDHPIHYSFIAVPNGFVVPGGINKESYYLDSYWIIRGLLVNDMTTTVKGILNNFILMEKKYGYIPRGTRIYYCNNWQPPVLSLLVDLYMKQTNDIYWLRENIDVLDHELRHWLNYRCFELTRNGEVYTLARYTNSNPNPRPDKYHLDYSYCSIFNTTNLVKMCYTNIKAPGGSGWYYPERYIFDENCSTNASVAYTYPRRVLPVDLNVYLCKSFQVMSQFYEKLNDHINATFYKKKYEHWIRSIQKILYSANDGIWYDYDIGQHKKRPYCYPTNFAPLWAEIFDKRETPKLGKKALGYFKRMNMMPFRGSEGLPQPKHDLLKMFMPFKHMVVLGLYNSGDAEAQDYAREFMRRWLVQSIECECCKYDIYDDVDLRSYEFRWGCGWLVVCSLDLINTFFVTPKME